MGKSVLCLLFVLACVSFARAESPAYSAEGNIAQGDHVVRRLNVWSDGTVTLRDWSDDHGVATSYYYDKRLHAMWVYGAKEPCHFQPSEGDVLPRNAKEVGSDTRLGRTVTKMQIWEGQPGTPLPADQPAFYEWRAKDLDDLVVGWRKPDGTAYTMTRLDVGAPPVDKLTFPAACTGSTPPSHALSSTFRPHAFAEIACGHVVAAPFVIRLPPGFVTRATGGGCFTGLPDDLDRLLAEPGTSDFEAVHRWVLWVKNADTTTFDAQRQEFVSELGPESQWKTSLDAQHATQVSVEHRLAFGIHFAALSARIGGKPLRVLFMAAPNIFMTRLSLQSNATGAASDDEEWRTVIDSIDVLRPPVHVAATSPAR